MKHGRIGGNGYSPARGSSLGVIVKEGFHQSQDVLANGLLQSLSLALIGGIDTADDVGTKGALRLAVVAVATIRPSVRSTRAAAMVVVPMSMAMPHNAVIIGAGAIAAEFASMWNAAGCKVTMLIRKDRVLSGWDRRAGVTLTRELKRHGIDVIDRST